MNAAAILEFKQYIYLTLSNDNDIYNEMSIYVLQEYLLE